MRWRGPVILSLLAAALLAGCAVPRDEAALDVTGYLVSYDGQMDHDYDTGRHVVTCTGDKAVHLIVVTVAANKWPVKDAWRVHADGVVSPAMDLEYWSSGDGGSLYVYGCLEHGNSVDELTYEVDGKVQARAVVDQVPSTLMA